MKSVRITKAMAERLLKRFGRNQNLPDNINSDEAMLYPYGSKIIKCTRKRNGLVYSLFGYAADGSDVDRPLVDVWK